MSNFHKSGFFITMSFYTNFQCFNPDFLTQVGGFQLLDLIIMELKSYMTSCNSMPLIGGNSSIQTGEQIL